MKKVVILIFYIAVGVVSYSQGQSLFDVLKEPDPSTGATVIINQDEAITEILLKKVVGYEPVATLSRGWSIQVFSDNSENAKEEAFKIENKVKERMPYEYVRSERRAPFWKVRVGQFESSDEAQKLKETLIREFPELKGYIYIVKFNNN